MTALAKRSCGPCRVCCSELKIDTPEFRKKSQVPCKHLIAAGCGIYETRYKACQEFLCGWRLFGELNDDWRPDRSGVLMLRLGPEKLPPQYGACGYGVELAITGGEAAVTRPGFAEYVAGLLQRGIAVYLSAASPSTLVNAHLDADAGRNLAGTRGILLRLYQMAYAARWSRGPLMLPALYRMQLAQQRALLESAKKPTG